MMCCIVIVYEKSVFKAVTVIRLDKQKYFNVKMLHAKAKDDDGARMSRSRLVIYSYRSMTLTRVLWKFIL